MIYLIAFFFIHADSHFYFKHEVINDKLKSPFGVFFIKVSTNMLGTNIEYRWSLTVHHSIFAVFSWSSHKQSRDFPPITAQGFDKAVEILFSVLSHSTPETH